VLKEIKNHGRTFIDPHVTFHSQVQETCKILGMACHRVDLNLTPDSKTDLSDMTERNNFFKKVIQSAEENGTVIVSMPLISTVTSHLPEWISASEKKGVKFITINHSFSPELLPTVSRNDQSTENDNR